MSNWNVRRSSKYRPYFQINPYSTRHLQVKKFLLQKPRWSNLNLAQCKTSWKPNESEKKGQGKVYQIRIGREPNFVSVTTTVDRSYPCTNPGWTDGCRSYRRAAAGQLAGFPTHFLGSGPWTGALGLGTPLALAQSLHRTSSWLGTHPLLSVRHALEVLLCHREVGPLAVHLFHLAHHL